MFSRATMFSVRATATRTPLAARPFSTRTLLYARKDTMDKDSINTESNEYSKSGSDAAAAHSDAAFDPSTTGPQEEMDQAAGGSTNNQGGNALGGSPGNSDLSKHKKEEISGSSQSAGPSDQSGEKASGGKSTGKKVS